MIFYITDSSENLDKHLYKNKDIQICTLGFSKDKKILSLARYIEENSFVLRSRYIEFIDELAQKKLGSKKIIDILKIHNNYSYWFSSSLFEKSIYSQNYSDSIRLLAIQDIIKKNKISKIFLSIDSILLAKSLNELCIDENVEIIIQNKTQGLLFNIFRNSFILNFTRSLIFFMKLSLRKFSKKEIEIDKEGILFISPLSYLNTKIDENYLKFNSNLWSGIPELFENKSINANFLHIFSPHQEIESPKQASKLINVLNKSNKSNHYLMDINLPFLDKCFIFYNWLKISFKFIFYHKTKKIFYLKDSNVNLYKILNKNFMDTFMGPNLIYCMFAYKYLEKKIDLFLNSKKIFFLHENQGWENIVTFIVNTNSKNKLYAVPHSTIRFWDLRHFHSKLLNKSDHSINIDYYLMNSQHGKDHYENNYGDINIIECEALRYREKPKSSMDYSNELLVLLDYSRIYTENMMSFLEEYERNYPNNIKFVFKEHINSPIELKKYKFASAEKTSQSINTVLNKYKKCFCSNMTSAQVDAYTFGLDVLVFHDGKELDMSPLKGNEFVKQINTIDDLKSHIEKEGHPYKVTRNYFYQDKSLEKWSSILFDKV